jgi:hypothetical protein
VSTAGGVAIAICGVLLVAKPRLDAATDEGTRKVVAAAAVFWVTLVLRAVAALVWGLGTGKKAGAPVAVEGVATRRRAAARRA